MPKPLLVTASSCAANADAGNADRAGAAHGKRVPVVAFSGTEQAMGDRVGMALQMKPPRVEAAAIEYPFEHDVQLVPIQLAQPTGQGDGVTLRVADVEALTVLEVVPVRVTVIDGVGDADRDTLPLLVRVTDGVLVDVKDALLDSDCEGVADGVVLGDAPNDSDAVGDGEPDAELVMERDGVTDDDKERETVAVGVTLGVTDADSDTEGVTLGVLVTDAVTEGVTELEGVTEGDGVTNIVQGMGK